MTWRVSPLGLPNVYCINKFRSKNVGTCFEQGLLVTIATHPLVPVDSNHDALNTGGSRCAGICVGGGIMKFASVRLLLIAI